jgi:predicted NBD/HSP70 family sugar kinase
VLKLVHRAGPHSRAAITERTGLNRSTVAHVVADLAKAGLVAQSDPASTENRVGRPSPTVSAIADVAVLAANPEVDALTLAVIGLDRSVRARARIPFHESPTPEQVVAALTTQLDTWRAGDLRAVRFIGVGLAVPGLVREPDALVRDAPHLGWRDVALRELLEPMCGLPVSLRNDATLGVWAERLYGAARDADDAIYLNGGASGIGGGLVIGGALVHGANGYAGEFGHNHPGGAQPDDLSTAGGTLEDEVNRARLVRALGLRDLYDPALAAALASAHGPALDEANRQRRVLAAAIANAANVLNPTRVVLGGFLAMLAELDLDELHRLVIASTLPANGEALDIRPAELADDRLVVGAAELAFARLLDSPLTHADTPAAESP